MVVSSSRIRSRLFLALLAAAHTLLAANPALIAGIGVVTFRVSSLEPSLRFYRDLLGYPIAFTAGQSTLLRINERQYVELVANLPPTENKRLSEIRFEVSNFDSVPPLPSTPPLLSRDGTRVRHFTDPDENSLALVHYEPQSLKLRAPQPTRDERISRHLLHAGIVVERATLDQALRFYGQTLGFTEFWRGGPEGQPTAWINMRTEGSRGDYVELMLTDGPPNRQRLGSMQHICLKVPDIHAAAEIIRRRDTAHSQNGIPRVGRNGKWQLNLFDPDGSRVELMEPGLAKSESRR